MHAFPRTFPQPKSQPLTGVLAGVPLTPLTPSAYLRLCREAARMSISAAAIMMMHNRDEVPAAMDLIRSLERKGTVARHRETLEALRAAFPFDPDVYHQLATEPAARHPHICRGCGASEWDQRTDTHGAFAWASPHACTRCIGDEAAQAEQAA